MERELAARAAGVIPHHKLPLFLEYLVRSPETPHLCDSPHPTEERLQGDVIKGFPFCMIAPDGQARTAVLTVAVINNTCDLQKNRSQLINIAAASDYPSYRRSVIESRGETKAQGFLSAVENNGIAELFFVRRCPGFEDGMIIFLDKVATVSVGIYEQALIEKRRVASFTQNGFYVFLVKLANYFARAETPDVARLVLPN